MGPSGRCLVSLLCSAVRSKYQILSLALTGIACDKGEGTALCVCVCVSVCVCLCVYLYIACDLLYAIVIIVRTATLAIRIRTATLTIRIRTATRQAETHFQHGT